MPGRAAARACCLLSRVTAHAAAQQPVYTQPLAKPLRLCEGSLAAPARGRGSDSLLSVVPPSTLDPGSTLPASLSSLAVLLPPLRASRALAAAIDNPLDVHTARQPASREGASMRARTARTGSKLHLSFSLEPSSPFFPTGRQLSLAQSTLVGSTRGNVAARISSILPSREPRHEAGACCCPRVASL